jgi:hypothetical protein
MRDAPPASTDQGPRGCRISGAARTGVAVAAVQLRQAHANARSAIAGVRQYLAAGSTRAAGDDACACTITASPCSRAGVSGDSADYRGTATRNFGELDFTGIGSSVKLADAS